jgi:hypothetical protein
MTELQSTPSRIDALKMMYEEHAEQARHHETERSTITNFTIAAVAALIVFIASEKAEAHRYWYLALLIALLGSIGWLMSEKSYERNRLHCAIAAAYRDALATLADIRLWGIREAAEDDHNATHPLARLSLHGLWRVLYIAMVAGALIAALLMSRTN